MTEPHPAPAAADSCTLADRPAAPDAQHDGRPGLTRSQRVLAIAMTTAVIVSGINALVQVARVLIQGWPSRG